MKFKNTRLIFIIGYISYCMIYISRLNLSIAYTELTSITSAQYGYICSAFLITYSCGRLLNGMLGDRIHPRYMLFIGLVLSGLCNLGLSTIPPFYLFLLLWAVNGYAQSMLWGSLLTYISSVTTPEKRVTAVSVLVSSVAVGSVAGLLIATFATTTLGVRFSFLIPAIFSIAVAFLPLTIFNQSVVKSESQKIQHIPVYKLLCAPAVFMIIIPAILHGVIKDNISAWIPTYFKHEFGLGLSTMQLFVYIIPITGMIGRLIYPYLYKIFKFRENYVSVFSMIACTLSLIPLAFGVKNIFVSAICLCITSASINIINTSMLSMFPLKFEHTGNVSSVTGIMDFATYMGAGIGSAVYGVLLKNNNFNNMFISWILIAVLSSVILFVIIKQPKFEKIPGDLS